MFGYIIHSIFSIFQTFHDKVKRFVSPHYKLVVLDLPQDVIKELKNIAKDQHKCVDAVCEDILKKMIV